MSTLELAPYFLSMRLELALFINGWTGEQLSEEVDDRSSDVNAAGLIKPIGSPPRAVDVSIKEGPKQRFGQTLCCRGYTVALMHYKVVLGLDNVTSDNSQVHR